MLSNIKRLLNRNTALAIALVIILCFCSKAASGAEPPSVFELCLKQITGNGEKISYFSVLDCFDNNLWFYIILPVILSFSTVSDFYEEWNGGFYFSVSRTGFTKYVLYKSLSFSIISVGCFLIGFVIFGVILLGFFPNFDETTALFPQGVFAYFAAKIANISAVSASYPLICGIILLCIREKLLSLSAPLIINYFSSKISSDLFIKAHTEQKISYQKLAMLTPYMQTKQYAFFEETFGAPLAVWFLINALCYIGLVLLFGILIKRRISNA